MLKATLKRLFWSFCCPKKKHNKCFCLQPVTLQCIASCHVSRLEQKHMRLEWQCAYLCQSQTVPFNSIMPNPILNKSINLNQLDLDIYLNPHQTVVTLSSRAMYIPWGNNLNVYKQTTSQCSRKWQKNAFLHLDIYLCWILGVDPSSIQVLWKFIHSVVFA